MHAQGHRPWWLYSLAVAALATCIWIGWSDVSFWIPQAAVKEAVRAAPQQVIQILVQFIAPALLLGFLAREGAAHIRARRRA